MEREISLADMANVEPFSAHFARMGDNYILSHIVDDSAQDIKKDNMDINIQYRLNGMLLFVNAGRRITMTINLEKFDIETGSIMTVMPGTLMSFNDIVEPVDFHMLFVSTDFLESINLDVKTLSLRTFVGRPKPVMRLDERESTIIRKYISLLDLNADNDGNEASVFSKQIARSLISTIVYQLMKFSFDHLDADTEIQPETSTRVGSGYVRDFLKLLVRNYSSERSTAYYANQLCITAKYLSMIVKDATGRTASEWINGFVLLEAKNLLRFSGKNIQQVAYALNFPSQSSFGKFFKRLTGQSPTEYQKS